MFAVSINLLSVTPQELLKAYIKGGGKSSVWRTRGIKTPYFCSPLCKIGVTIYAMSSPHSHIFSRSSQVDWIQKRCERIIRILESDIMVRNFKYLI